MCLRLLDLAVDADRLTLETVMTKSITLARTAMTIGLRSEML